MAQSLPDLVRQIILRHLPAGTSVDRLHDGWPLGSEGAGLDSIALVELLLDCERHFGVPLSEHLLERGPVDVGALIGAVVARAGGETA